jgi:hypothetical protein
VPSFMETTSGGPMGQCRPAPQLSGRGRVLLDRVVSWAGKVRRLLRLQMTCKQGHCHCSDPRLTRWDYECSIGFVEKLGDIMSIDDGTVKT